MWIYLMIFVATAGSILLLFSAITYVQCFLTIRKEKAAKEEAAEDARAD